MTLPFFLACFIFGLPVSGAENLTDIYRLPFVSSPGALSQSDWIIDDYNHRIYVDGPYPTRIVAKSGQGVWLGGNDQMSDGVFIHSPNAGTALLNIISSGMSGAVGGGAFIRSSDNATIGMGYQTGSAATWDLDLLGMGSHVGAGYDFSINNKNHAGSLRLSAGSAVVLGNGIGEIVTEKVRVDNVGITYQPDARQIQEAKTINPAGFTQTDAIGVTTVNTLITGSYPIKGVRLPALPRVGDMRRLINTVDDTAVFVYPYFDSAINNHPINEPVILQSGCFCIAQSRTQWRCVEEAGM